MLLKDGNIPYAKWVYKKQRLGQTAVATCNLISRLILFMYHGIKQHWLSFDIFSLSGERERERERERHKDTEKERFW